MAMQEERSEQTTAIDTSICEVYGKKNGDRRSRQRPLSSLVFFGPKTGVGVARMGPQINRAPCDTTQSESTGSGNFCARGLYVALLIDQLSNSSSLKTIERGKYPQRTPPGHRGIIVRLLQNNQKKLGAPPFQGNLSKQRMKRKRQSLLWWVRSRRPVDCFLYF